MNADLTAIIADESKLHVLRRVAGPYLAQCVCNGWAGRPDDFEDHRAEQIAARLGIEPIGAWGTTSRLAPVRADGTTEQFELYRVRALESQ